MRLLNFEQYDNMLNEKLITFGKKTYPNYNNVVVMCGGGGSGKGFVVSNVLGIEAKSLNVDDIKETLTKFEDDSELSKKFQKEYGKPLSKVDLGNPKDCESLHLFVEAHHLAKKQYGVLFNEEFKKKNKSNIIFDVTLKSYPKIEDISGLCMVGGYQPENIHMVWVLNKFSVAAKQNKMRSRQVPEDILKLTHTGCAGTLKKLLNMSKSLGMVNGDIWIYFGSTYTGDAKMLASDNGGKYLEDFSTIKIKEAGKPLEDFESLMNRKINVYDKDHKVIGNVTLREKINEYIPEESERF